MVSEYCVGKAKERRKVKWSGLKFERCRYFQSNPSYLHNALGTSMCGNRPERKIEALKYCC